MKRLTILFLAPLFICQVDGKRLTCVSCGEPDIGCYSIFRIAKTFDLEKNEITPQQVNERLDDQVMVLKGRIDNLEAKIKK